MLGKIIDKKEVATDTLLVTFQLDQKVDFKPGQYIIVTLPRLNYPDERGLKRQFSINNNPSDNSIIQITTRITESGFKRTLKELTFGSTAELGPIAGTFVLPDDTNIPLVLIAGGIGITPFMSMLRFIREEKLPYQITLIYSNRNTASTAYLEEIKSFEKEITNFKLILIMSDQPEWTGETRRIEPNFIKEYFPNLNGQKYMVVGPPGMVTAVQNALLEAGILPENIKVENFTGY